MANGHLSEEFCRRFGITDEDLRGTKRDVDTGEEYACVVDFGKRMRDLPAHEDLLVVEHYGCLAEMANSKQQTPKRR